MFDLKHYIDKLKKAVNVDDVVKILEKLPNDPTLKQISDNAGLVGGIIKVGLTITQKVYDAKVPIQTRLSFTLMRIMLESAKDSIQLNYDLDLDDILNEDKDSEEMENIVAELFSPKYYVDQKGNGVTYLPDHPVISKFRSLLRKGINQYNLKNKSNINVAQFLTEFNSTLLKKLEEERKSNNKDLEKLLHKWKVHSDFHNLLTYVENAKNLFFVPNKVDQKSLSEYYVENKAYVVDKGTWSKDEDQIRSKKEWDIESFLKARKPIEVIAAPFGIGKSSLATKMAYDCATKFIQDPTDPVSYIPIFVSLKYSLESTCNGNSLENDLADITSRSDRLENANILVILDGLDELPADKPINIFNIYTQIQGLIKGYPNRKFIISTRLEAGFPDRLNIKDSYIRLFSFSESQIRKFFKMYGLAGDYEKISNVLTKEKLVKPLFCWMIATVYNKSSKEEREILFGYSNDYLLGQIFLYQQFIHNVILGKPKDVAIEEFEEWVRRSKDEKRALRLIAFLKNNDPFLSTNKALNYLESLNFRLPKSSESLISTYFSTTHDEQGTQKLEFIHKSFQEYLLAEFYIESIFNGKYHRLIGNEPSKETYSVISGLLKFICTADPHVTKHAENLVRTFYEDNNTRVELRDFIRTLKSNSMKFAAQKDLLPYFPREETQIWNLSPPRYDDLYKVWISRWLSIYMAGNLTDESSSLDEDFLSSSSFFIKRSTHFVQNKLLLSTNLKGIDLKYSNLSIANLSGANLSGANLSGASLSGASFSGASFSGANLSRANFSGARLVNANLSGANLSGANLSGADLSNSLFVNLLGYSSLKLDAGTNFKGSITDNSDFRVNLRNQIPEENLPNVKQRGS